MAQVEAYQTNFATLNFGLVNSYFLNRTILFRYEGLHRDTMVRFMGSVAIAYGVNLAVLKVLLELNVFHVLASQFIAFSSYTAVAYILHRWWTFSKPS